MESTKYANGFFIISIARKDITDDLWNKIKDWAIALKPHETNVSKTCIDGISCLFVPVGDHDTVMVTQPDLVKALSDR